MQKDAKKLIAFAACCLISAAVVIAGAVLNGSDTKLVLSGMKLIRNGETTQTYIDVSIKDVEASSVAFCLKYDTEYLSLSESINNQAIASPENGFDLYHKYFSQNAALPENLFIDDLGLMGQADSQKGYVMMYLVPQNIESPDNENIGNVDVDGEKFTVMKAAGKTLKLGDISFNVKKPTELAKLSAEELKEVIKIVPFSSVPGMRAPEIGTEDYEDNGAYIGYYDEYGDSKFYSVAETELKITAGLKKVTPDVPQASVSSLDVYANGSIDDMIAYLNSYMSDLTLEYADNTKVADSFVWNKNDESFTVNKDWTATGGEYTITQNYNDDNSITVTLNVIPVSLTGIYADKKSSVYLSSNTPQTLKELEIPPVVHTILSNPSSTKKGFDIAIENWYIGSNAVEDIPAGILNGDEGEYIFSTGELANDYIRTLAPWLTVPENNYSTEIVRTVVGSQSDVPAALNVSGEWETNTLKITASYKSGNMSEGSTEFEIRLQDGSLLSSELYDVSFADGAATIKVKSLDLNNSEQAEIAKKINLGNRLGPMKIAAKETGGKQGEFAELRISPRQNVYTESVVFDYTDLMALMFPVNTAQDGQQELSTTIVLPGSDRVPTTYNGYDGSEPGQLKTVTVENWATEKDSETGIVTAVGKLADSVYSNYGLVENRNNITITIKYQLKSDKETMSIQSIDDFKFNSQTHGYGYNDLQKKTFEIKNTGTCDINGLSVTIGADDDGNECFALLNPPASILKKDGTASFDIMVKRGISVGTHVSTVTISSNQTVLGTFTVQITISKTELYDIEIVVDDELMGTAEVESGIYTASEGDSVTISATANKDYAFHYWMAETDDPNISVILDDEYASSTTFTMPACNVVIYAYFTKSKAADLKLETLSSYNLDESENKLRDGEWKIIDFNSDVNEYRVAVAHGTEKNKLVFKPIENAQNATVNVTQSKDADSEKTELTVTKDEETGVYTVEFDLYKDSIKNEIFIGLSFEENPLDIRGYNVTVYQELAISDMVSFKCGNSAYAMIEKMGEAYGGTWSEEDITKAKESFSKNNKFTEYIPDGGNESIWYSPSAWANDSVNCDKDSAAWFIVNNGQMTGSPVDIGWNKLTNSVGEPVDEANVTRSLNVTKLTDTTESEWGTTTDFSTVENVTLPVELDSMTNQYTIQGMSELRIRPDVYKLRYTFKDYDGDDIYIEKPVIILTSLGDMNVDHQVDRQDWNAILERFDKYLPYNNVENYSTGARLYKYRVCDVNKDGFINAIDANTIKSNNIIQFYKNQ